MNYEIVDLTEKLVEGVAVRTTNTPEGMQKIGALWGNFFTSGAINNIENSVNAYTIGLYTEYEGDFTKPYCFMAGKEVSKPSVTLQERVVKKIPAGKYAKFKVQGDMQEAVGKFWTDLWNMQLDRKYSSDFEEYRGEVNGTNEIYIYIALN